MIPQASAAMPDPKMVDVRRLTIPAVVVVGVLGMAAMAGGELRSLRLAAEAGAASDERILAAIKERPTNDAVHLTVIEAMRPFETAMAEVKAQLTVLTAQTERVEERVEAVEEKQNGENK